MLFLPGLNSSEQVPVWLMFITDAIPSSTTGWIQRQNFTFRVAAQKGRIRFNRFKIANFYKHWSLEQKVQFQVRRMMSSKDVERRGQKEYVFYLFWCWTLNCQNSIFSFEYVNFWLHPFHVSIEPRWGQSDGQILDFRLTSLVHQWSLGYPSHQVSLCFFWRQLDFL